METAESCKRDYKFYRTTSVITWAACLYGLCARGFWYIALAILFAVAQWGLSSYYKKQYKALKN